MLMEVAERVPDKEAFVSVDIDGNERRVTYSQLVDDARALSAGLAKIGLRQGDRTVFWMTNLPEWIVSYFAFLRIGVVGVPVNTWLKVPEIKYVMTQSRSRHLLVLDQFRKLDFLSMLEEIVPEWRDSEAGSLFSDEVPELRTVIVFKRGGLEYTDANAFSFAGLAEAGRNDPQAVELADRMEKNVKPSDLALVKYTSGSTGFPKGAMLEQGGIVANAMLHTERLQVHEGNERWFSPMPFFHAGGSVWGMMTTLSRGSTLLFTEAFEPDVALQIIGKEQCTAVFGVPAMVRDMLTLVRGGGLDLSSVRIATASDPSLADEVSEVYPNLEVGINAFGLTEVYGPACVSSPDTPMDVQRATCGKFFDGVEWKVIDPTTKKAVGPGHIGEALIRGPVMRGYWDKPEETARAIDEEGWLHTEDLISVDEEGYVKYVGRIKAMLKTGGENVAVEEVEHCLFAHPAVFECIVVGIPDERKDQVGRAYVVLEPGKSTDAEELRTWCNERLARFKVPAEYVFVESLPRTGSQKIDRAAVQRMADDSIRVAVDG
jgi:fatty-acyl-CoA synthase